MANDQQWQRCTDEWVKSMHRSRLQKEQRFTENQEKADKKKEAGYIKMIYRKPA